MLKHLMTARAGVLLVAILVVFLACRWALSPAAPPEPAERAQHLSVASAPVIQPQAPAPRLAATSPTPAVPAQPVTDDRRRILDSPEVMGTLRQVRASGTPDEKRWALELLSVCVEINVRASKPRPESDVASQGESANAASHAALAALKKRALDTLALRCRDVRSVSLDDRRALQSDLRDGVASGRSVYAQLHALASAQDDRWSSVQAQQITDALYSGDPALAREGFYALQGAMDRDSPGGEDRHLALVEGLGPIFEETPLSDLDRLGVCLAFGKCGSAWDVQSTEPPSNSEVTRLARKYRNAVESHMDARSIMAIR